jgi:hypothetical protein
MAEKNDFSTEPVSDTKTILRQIRESLVDLFVAFARALFFWIPGGDVAKGKALMTFHPIFLLFVTASFFVTASQSSLRFIIVIVAVVTVASQWLLGGCVVTRAEQKLTGSNETILDPFLVLGGVQVNRDTRIAATIASGTTVCFLLVWAFLCDMWR